jgi:hypothetical protein
MFQVDRLVLGTMAIAEDARFLFASSSTPQKIGLHSRNFQRVEDNVFHSHP